jgi:hypothetical protein
VAVVSVVRVVWLAVSWCVLFIPNVYGWTILDKNTAKIIIIKKVTLSL